jgi:hypothetical protein
VRIFFADDSRHAKDEFFGSVSVKTFGREQYAWHPDVSGGTADPDGPIAASTVAAGPGTTFTLPAASVTVFRGEVKKSASSTK